MNKIIFLSYFLDENTPIYGGIENSFVIKSTNQIKNGDSSNNMHLSFPNHIGTHIDFPYHFNNEGKRCSDYPASFWYFSKIGFLNCKIEDIEKEAIKLPKDIEILIIKTGFGNKRGQDEYWQKQPVIPSGLAYFLKINFSKIRIFGFDLISLTSKLNREEGKKAHLDFLINNDILVLEDMKLDELIQTPLNLIIAPLQVKNADGSPCNVFAW